MANKALHWTGIPLRSIPASELDRWTHKGKAQMNTFDDSEEQLLTEYRTLKGEISQITSSITSFTLATLTVSSATIGLGFHSQSPWPPVAGTLFAFCALLYIKSRTNGMVKIGTYISTFLEPRLKGLRWETALNEAHEVQKYEKYGHFGTLTIYTANMIATLLAFNLLLFLNTKPATGKALPVNSVGLCLIIVAWVVYKFDFRPKYDKGWKLYWERKSVQQDKSSVRGKPGR